MKKMLKLRFLTLIVVLVVSVVSCNDDDDDNFIPEIITEFGNVFVSGDTIYLSSGDTLNFTASITNRTDVKGLWSVADKSILKYEDGKFITLKNGTTTISYAYNDYESKTVITVNENAFYVETEKFAIDSLVDLWFCFDKSVAEPKAAGTTDNTEIACRHNLVFYAKDLNFISFESYDISGFGMIVELTTVVEGQDTYAPLIAGSYPLFDFYSDYYNKSNQESEWVDLVLNNSSFSVRVYNNIYEIKWKGVDEDDKNCSLYYLGKINKAIKDRNY